MGQVRKGSFLTLRGSLPVYHYSLQTRKTFHNATRNSQNKKCERKMKSRTLQGFVISGAKQFRISPFSIPLHEFKQLS